jgi:hypothetical protein
MALKPLDDGAAESPGRVVQFRLGRQVRGAVNGYSRDMMKMAKAVPVK